MIQKALPILLIFTLLFASVSAQDTTSVDLDAIKTYTAENAAQMKEATEAFLTATTNYYDLVATAGETSDTPYETLAAESGDEVIALITEMRDTWFDASLYYELSEGIVAGTPSLEQFDILLDAGDSAEDNPEEALEWTLVLPDGTELESPGNIFHSLSEPALYGTLPEYVAYEGELSEEITSLPDANFILGVAQRLDEETGNLITAVDEWEPTLDDAFHALVVMIPTMSEYFGQWKDSVYVAGDEAEEAAFIGASRLFDIVNILNGLRVVYDTISPDIEAVSTDLNVQIDEGFNSLQEFVTEVYDDELAGVTFVAEEVDLLGTEAQSRAEDLASLVAQAATGAGIELELE